MDKVLAIATNDATELHGKKTGLWLSELTHFLDVIEAAGYGYDLASPRGGRIPLDEKSLDSLEKDPINAKYMADSRFKNSLENSLRCGDVDAAQYVAIYLSGGHGTMFDFRQSGELQQLIGRFHAADKFLTGVCHGVSGFIDSTDAAGNLIVKGRHVTGFSNAEDTIAGVRKLMPFLLEDELKKNGALYQKNLVPFTARVEADGRVITGQNPQSAQGVGEKLVEELRRR